jgi:hypothetical protein
VVVAVLLVVVGPARPLKEKKSQRYFQKDYLGGVKTEKLNN